jgi:hypothetical protein
MLPVDRVVKQLSILHSSSAEAPTSFKLATEIVDQLECDWDDPDLTLLDPVCGRGNFLLAAYKKLLAHGHRPRHIVKNMLYGVDLNNIQCAIASRALLDVSGVVPNIYCDNILTREWNMEFDAVVGNPPYQLPDAKTSGGGHTLWKQISSRAFELLKKDGCIAFVTPAVPYHNKKDLGPKFRELQTVAVCSDASRHFPGVGSQFTWWIVKNTPKHKLTRIVDLGYDIDLATIPSNRRKFLPLIASGILDKIDAAKVRYGYHLVTDDNSNLGNKDNTVEKPAPDYPYPVRWGSIQKFRYAATKTHCYDKNRVMCTFSGNPGWEYFDSTNGASSVGAMSGYLLVDNADQGARFIAQVDLNINKFERKMIKGSGAFTSPGFWQSIKFDLDTDISDADAYTAVGLTPDEIAYVEVNI